MSFNAIDLPDAIGNDGSSRRPAWWCCEFEPPAVTQCRSVGSCCIPVAATSGQCGASAGSVAASWACPLCGLPVTNDFRDFEGGPKSVGIKAVRSALPGDRRSYADAGKWLPLWIPVDSPSGRLSRR